MAEALTEDPNGRVWPRVFGRCPACGRSTLFLGEGGHVTCSSLECPDPTLASTSMGHWGPNIGEPHVGVHPLTRWWHKLVDRDMEPLLPKIEEYTSADLEVMGAVMSEWGLVGSPSGSPADDAGTSSSGPGMEAACLWYILGKVARAVAAYKDGRLPSEDTLHDISVYAMMARRIRETGVWP